MKLTQFGFRWGPETVKSLWRLKAAHKDIPGDRLVGALIRWKDRAIQERLPTDLVSKYMAGKLDADEWREGAERFSIARRQLGLDAEAKAVADLAATIKINGRAAEDHLSLPPAA